MNNLEELSQWMKERNLKGHWEHSEWSQSVKPHLWKGGDILQALNWSGELITTGEAGRRTIQMRNPGLSAGMTNTVHISVQLVKPGEVAAAHRHTAAAIRFIVKGTPNAYTVVDDPALGYPDHLYLYTGGVNSFTYAATRPQQWPPNLIGRYRNTDPVLINYLIRLAVEKKGLDYHSYPQRALFDKIGIRTMVMETDPFGNFLTQGYEYASARDWVRLGNLYLQDGMWNGERILPEGFVKFVSTLAESWIKDGRPIYGGFFWINGDGARPIPNDAYMMLGAGGQSTTIIPSHELVIVRMGHYRGGRAGDVSLDKAYTLIMEAVPAKD